MRLKGLVSQEGSPHSTPYSHVPFGFAGGLSTLHSLLSRTFWFRRSALHTPLPTLTYLLVSQEGSPHSTPYFHVSFGFAEGLSTLHSLLSRTFWFRRRALHTPLPSLTYLLVSQEGSPHSTPYSHVPFGFAGGLSTLHSLLSRTFWFRRRTLHTPLPTLTYLLVSQEGAPHFTPYSHVPFGFAGGFSTLHSLLSSTF